MSAPQLYVSCIGKVRCAKHAPYQKSAEWRAELWRAVTGGDVAAWKESGYAARCGVCATTNVITEPNGTKEKP